MIYLRILMATLVIGLAPAWGEGGVGGVDVLKLLPFLLVPPIIVLFGVRKISTAQRVGSAFFNVILLCLGYPVILMAVTYLVLDEMWSITLCSVWALISLYATFRLAKSGQKVITPKPAKFGGKSKEKEKGSRSARPKGGKP